MKRLRFLVPVFFLFLISIGNAQNKYLKASDSDNDAIVILEKSKGMLDNAETLIFDYTLTTQIPETSPQSQGGIAKQKGNKYYLEMGDRTIYCNGNNVMIYLRTQNELQINDLGDESGMITPDALLNSFDKERYVFVLGNNKKIKNNIYYNIVFKPVEKYSEYSKIETLINKKTLLPYKIVMLYKDGTKNTLEINSIEMNQLIEDSVFIFNRAEHLGVSVEDLRMN